MYCTCGGRMKTHKMGEIIILKGMLHSCDSFRCVNCGKTIVASVAPEPMAVAESERADKIIESMLSRGMNVYGAGGE